MKANGITVIRDEEYFTKSINRDKRVSLKAKGLHGLVLDLPKSWELSIRGIAAICKEGKDAIGAAIQELVTFGYCKLDQVREGGKFQGYHYTFYEVSLYPDKTPLPYPGKPDTVKPDTEKPDTENPPQYKQGIKDNKNIKRGEGNTGQGGGSESKFNMPPLTSPPVALWLKLTGEAVTIEGAALIEKRVKILRAWEDCLEGWIASGWNKKNIAGQLNRYDKMIRENDYPEEFGDVPTGEDDKPKEQEEDFKDLIFS